MNKQLTTEQRKFLIYLRDNHASVGMGSVISNSLVGNSYDIDTISRVVDNFKGLVHELNTGETTHRYCTVARYGKPTKYLKM